MESEMTQKAHFRKKYDTLLKKKFGSPAGTEFESYKQLISYFLDIIH